MSSSTSTGTSSDPGGVGRKGSSAAPLVLECSSYRGHRFPREIISRAVWLYHRFCLSVRDVEDLLAERGITASYETLRHWRPKFGTEYARTLIDILAQAG